MEARINQLESLTALQDDTIAALNTEIFRQQQDIAKLSTRLDRLEEKLAELADPKPISGNERPPHY